MKALCFDTYGAADVLDYKEVAEPVIQSNTVLVRTKAIGLNFADIYRRRGDYYLEGQPPYILGYEGAGIVEAVGEGVTHLKVGDRVGFADVPFASAEYVAVPESRAIPLPEGISFEVAASTLLQGLTADFLIHDSYQIQPNEIAVIHAISGGVGQLLTQMIKGKGALVLGITSTLSKQELALALGADAVFLKSDQWKDGILQYTNGKGSDVVYDGVGSTLLDSFAVVKTGGAVVFYGTAGGDPQFLDPKILIDESKSLTGGDLWKFLTNREERLSRANRLFKMILNEQINVSSPTVFPLAEGAEGHKLLESGQSTGKVIFVP